MPDLSDDCFEIEVPARPMHLERRCDGLVAVRDVKVRPLTAELVRSTLEETRERLMASA